MDVQLDPFYLDGLGDDEYKRLYYDLNSLMEIKGDPEGKNTDAQERYRQISRLVGNDIKEFDSNVDLKNIQ